jgi:hypothetical protein
MIARLAPAFDRKPKPCEPRDLGAFAREARIGKQGGLRRGGRCGRGGGCCGFGRFSVFHEATVPCGLAKGPSRETTENFFADRERVFAA